MNHIAYENSNLEEISNLRKSLYWLTLIAKLLSNKQIIKYNIYQQLK